MDDREDWKIRMERGKNMSYSSFFFFLEVIEILNKLKIVVRILFVFLA